MSTAHLLLHILLNFVAIVVPRLKLNQACLIRSITIDIINAKALKLLKDLELLQLIRVRNEKGHDNSTNWAGQYKGAMTKQSTAEIDSQLNALRKNQDFGVMEQ